MTVQIEKIKITNRIRKEVAKIAELSEDIRVNGLINPITVMSLGTAGNDGNSSKIADDDAGEYDYQLLAGLRRLRATEMLGHTEISINVVTPSDAEAILMIEISENEQREEFTFSEKMDFARILEEVEREKAKARLSAGQSNGGKVAGNGRVKESCSMPLGAESNSKGSTRDKVAEKIGMGKTNYDRAKYIADNASEEIIDELDKGERSIRGTFDEMKAKEKADQQPSDVLEDSSENSLEDALVDESETNPDSLCETASNADTQNLESTQKPKNKKDSSPEYPEGMFSKADLEADRRNKEFHAMSDADKVAELKRQLKHERTRAATAETELARLKEFHDNLIYHKDGAIKNLQTRLDTAEARVHELEALLGSDANGAGGQ